MTTSSFMANNHYFSKLFGKFRKWVSNLVFSGEVVGDDTYIAQQSIVHIPDSPLEIICHRDVTPHDCRVYVEYRLIYELFCKRNFDKQSLLRVPLKDMADFGKCKDFVFEWEDVRQHHIEFDDYYSDIILFKFPKPKEAGEAIYGIVYHCMNKRKYYLLEYINDDVWMWGEYIHQDSMFWDGIDKYGNPTGGQVPEKSEFSRKGRLNKPSLNDFIKQVFRYKFRIAEQIIYTIPYGWNR